MCVSTSHMGEAGRSSKMPPDGSPEITNSTSSTKAPAASLEPNSAKSRSAHMTLHATKKNWLQVQGFNSANSPIVLTSNERRNAQFRAQQQKLESEFRARQPGESEADYYCRVITQRSPPEDYRVGSRMTCLVRIRTIPLVPDKLLLRPSPAQVTSCDRRLTQCSARLIDYCARYRVGLAGTTCQ